MKDSRLPLRDWLISGRVPAPDHPHEAEVLLCAVEQQGLVGLLADEPAIAAKWPAAAQDRLRQAARGCLVRSTRQLDLAARVHGLLMQRDLRSLPLKGAAVAETLYDSPAHRPMSDIDLLAIDDPEASLRVLRDHGYVPVSAAEHAWALADPETGGTLELHRSMTSCPGLFPIDTEALWQRRDIRRGQVPCAPSPADLLLLLSLHASFQHGLVLTLSQWMDFRRLAERFPADVRISQSLARGVTAARAMAAALLAAEIAVASPLATEQRAWAEGTLPRGMRARIAGYGMTPWSLIAPEPAALARVRWDLAAGRRHRLIWATLFPREHELAPGLLTRLARATRRVCRLAAARLR